MVQTSRLRVRSQSPDSDGRVLTITPESAGWTYVGFEVRHLIPGQSISARLEGREACLVVLTGTCDIRVDEVRFEAVGDRQTVFEDKAPGVVYAPAGADYQIVATTVAEVAICTAPAEGVLPARQIAADQMGQERRGQGTNTRFIRNVLPETEAAESLLITEVLTPGGHWSSYPPHKHDESHPGTETALEETYYHRLNPPQGFAFQRVYTDDREIDETVCVEDGDVVLVPRGYHPVGAPHGYDLYYLNVMAGPTRKWLFHNDPDHAWIVKR